VNSSPSFIHSRLSGGAHRRGLAAIVLLTFLPGFTSVLHAASLPLLQSLIAQLASDDSRLREKALGDLMELNKKDIPMLRAAALSQSPLLPGQIDAIRQAVTQIFLAAERYHVDPEIPGGFLGLHWTNPNPRPMPDGVVVDERIPGFPCCRLLQSGDVIVQIVDRPPIPLLTTNDLVRVVQRMWPGEVLHLKILRLGQPIDVSLVLDFLPVDLNQTNIDAWIQDRNKKAEAYWVQEFSVIDPASTPGSSQASTSVEP
jgi:hypothetical protein